MVLSFPLAPLPVGTRVREWVAGGGMAQQTSQEARGEGDPRGEACLVVIECRVVEEEGAKR